MHKNSRKFTEIRYKCTKFSQISGATRRRVVHEFTYKTLQNSHFDGAIGGAWRSEMTFGTGQLSQPASWARGVGTWAAINALQRLAMSSCSSLHLEQSSPTEYKANLSRALQARGNETHGAAHRLTDTATAQQLHHNTGQQTRHSPVAVRKSYLDTLLN